MAFVVVERGGKEDTGKVFPLGEDVAVIGRAAPGNSPGIGVHDDYVSRHHAEISYHKSGFMLRDLGSKNGTEIDGQRIEPEKLYPLRHDSAIGLGITAGGARVVLRLKQSPTTATARIPEVDEVKPVSWLKIDEERREVWVAGKPLGISKKEYSLLAFLYHKAGKVCSKDEIIAEVWPEVKEPGAVSDAAIDQLLHRLREKVEPDPSKPSRIINKKGFGCMLT